MFKAAPLIGFGQRRLILPGGGGGGISLTYIGNTNDNSNLTTYTFSGVAIGPASTAKRIVVATGTGGTSGGVHTCTSLTIGGVSATIHATHGKAGNNSGVAIASLLVTAGDSDSTKDIVVTWNSATARCAVTVYNILDETNATPVWAGAGAVTATTGTVPNTGTITGNPGAGVACIYTLNDGPYAWSVPAGSATVTERVDYTMEGSFGDYSSASFINADAATIRATHASGDPCMVGAYWE